MSKVSRREFLTLAGAVPLGLAFPEHAPDLMASQLSPSELIDPWIEIDLNNMAWNVSQIRKSVGDRPIMAVIKCNAYGHGLVGVAQFLEKQNIRHFAVVKVHEAVLLRDHGIKGNILNFGPLSKEEAEQIVQNNVSQSVFSGAADSLAEAARLLNKQARVHIKVDTGLGRVGVPYHKAISYIEKVASMKEIIIEGIFTTFSEDEDFDKIQLKRFIKVCKDAEKEGIAVGLRHAASSAAVSTFPDSYLDMVRPGNCIYGLEPLPNMDLRPVMSLKTRVIYVKKLRPGDAVGYHRAYKAEKERLIATLPLGYADGYPHQAVNRAQVLIKGMRWHLLATLSANHSYVDITGAKGIKIGDEVVLFGSQKDLKITIGEVAEWGESSVYKVAIGMSPFLPRIY